MAARTTIRAATNLCLGVAILAWASGCDDTRRDWSSCVNEACAPGFACVAQRCVPAPDGAVTDTQAVEAPRIDTASPAEAGAPDMPAIEVAFDTGALADATVDVVADAPPLPAVDAALDVSVDAGVDAAIDTYVPDAPGTCSGDDDCRGASPYCVDGRCAGCKTSAHCAGSTPICSATHACVSCALVDAGCAGVTPACDPVSGRCVECVSNDGCPLAGKPICDSATNTCVPCTRDEQCAGIGPGVCMAHLDGHCATDAETVYVGSTAATSCSDTLPSAGSTAAPYCSAQKAVLAAKARGKALVLLSGVLSGGFTGVALTAPLTVVGRDVKLTPADFSDAIGITSGEVYLRDLILVGNPAGQTGVGINAQATANATLVVHIDGCTIKGHPGGGILLAGASFDIRNTVVTGNGPGQTSGGATFGGIRIDSLPSSGSGRLDLVTLRDNLGPGLSCAGAIQGEGVLASGNATPNVTNSCGVTPCAAASETCGAQLP